MDTISKHRKTLCGRYSARKKAGETIESAKALVVLALKSEHLLIRHRRKMISEALWWISEADGKYATRFRTKEVYDLASGEGNDEIKIQHEHVYPRKEVAHRLLANSNAYLSDPGKLDEELELTIGCTVTESQHRLLKNGATGWDRYKDVVVYDMSGEEPAIHTA